MACDIWREDDDIVISARYNPRFAEALKEAIPPRHRWWDAEEKVWRATVDYYDQVIDIAREFYFDVVVHEGRPGGPKARGRVFDDDGTDWKAVAIKAQMEVTRLKELLRNQPPPPSSSGGDSFINRLAPFLRNKDLLGDLRRILAKRYHPDITKDGGAKMKEINIILDQMEGK